MKTIWKFQLEAEGMQSVYMPNGSTILYAREQGQSICIWAEVTPDYTREERKIEVFPTGERMHTDMGVSRKYLGSAHVNNGELVFHVYERLG